MGQASSVKTLIQFRQYPAENQRFIQSAFDDQVNKPIRIWGIGYSDYTDKVAVLTNALVAEDGSYVLLQVESEQDLFGDDSYSSVHWSVIQPVPEGDKKRKRKR